MKVMVLGLRGIPNVQGGVESHVERLYPWLVKMGCQVEVVVRSPYVPPAQNLLWEGIRLHRLWSLRHKSLEAIFHTLLGVLYAAIRRPDVLHIHAIGPSLFTPLARLLGLRVVVTHHGPDYDRQKWGLLGRSVLLLAEALGMRFANQRIVISRVIHDIVRRKHALDSVIIPNGVVLPNPPDTTATATSFGLEKGRYVLLVSRLVPEKRHLDLIEAFERAALPGWKLAIVGACEHSDAYVSAVTQRAQETLGVVMTGFQSGMALQELYANAGLFVLPSSHEGLPIALLEALSYGLSVIASDIPANLELALEKDRYFPLGDIDALSQALRRHSRQPLDEAGRQAIRAGLREKYDWQRIAQATLQVYRAVMAGKAVTIDSKGA